jgi:DNA-binding response OmpR family regulator
MMPSTQTHYDVPPQRLLLVDDNRDAAEFLAALLRMDGHEVSLAFDMGEAVQQAALFKPAVALIDIDLPDRRGLEMAGELRRWDSLRPMLLVAVSGAGGTEARSRAQRAGFQRYLTKPIEYETVQSVLLEWDTAS